MSRKRVDAEAVARAARARVEAARAHGHAAPGGPEKGNGAGGPPQVAAPDPGLGPAASLRLDALGWLESPPPPTRWLLEDVLALGEVGVVAAPGATAKTWLLLQMALGLASGTGIADFGLCGPLWKPQVPVPVLVLTAEEHAHDLHRRIWAIVQSLRLSERCKGWLLANFHVRSLRGHDNLLLVREPGSLRWRPTDQATRIRQLCAEIDGLGLVIIEPVSRFRGSDENDAAAASALVAWMENLSEERDCTVLTAAHVAKWSRQESELTQDSIRGSSALVDGARWGAIMRRMQPAEAEKLGLSRDERRSKIQLAIPKANNSAGHDNKWLEQMNNGVLRLVSLHSAERPAERGSPEEEYLRVVSEVSTFILSHPDEQWTIGGLERSHAGVSGVFRCGQKALRAILGRAVEEGRLTTAEGRGQGYLGVPPVVDG